MTDNDREQFAFILAGLAEALDGTVTEAKLEAYFSALQDLSIDEVRQAANILLGSVKWFPKPVEFREALAGSAADRAESAWRTFAQLCREQGHYPSLWVTDGALGFAIEHLGGWITAQAKVKESSPEMLRAFEKEFLASYRLGLKRNLPAAYFAGHYEVTNRGQLSALVRFAGSAITLPVCFVETDRFRELKMQLDPATGHLATECRIALESGQIQRYLPAPIRRLPALPPAEVEPASPEEIAMIRERVAGLLGQFSGKGAE